MFTGRRKSYFQPLIQCYRDSMEHGVRVALVVGVLEPSDIGLLSAYQIGKLLLVEVDRDRRGRLRHGRLAPKAARRSDAQHRGRSGQLVGESYETIGAALHEAIFILDSADRSERNRIKDIIEDINENRNTATDCSSTGDDDDDPPPGASCAGVEIPPGQFPPPGECKIWDPRLPAGQQGPPRSCNELCRRKPSGTCVIDHNGNVVC